jgi:hypothetical protein
MEMKTSSLSKDHETGFNASCIQNGPTLSLKLAFYFMLPIMIKGGKLMIVRTLAPFDSGASACFIDKKLVRQHNLALVEKVTPMAIEVINCQNLFSRSITHETKMLTVTIESHSNKVVLMSSHFRQTLSSLDYHGSFCIILEWIGRQRVFILNQ